MIDFANKEPDEPLLFWNTFNSIDFTEILEKLDVEKLPRRIRSIIKMKKPMDVEMMKELERELQ